MAIKFSRSDFPKEFIFGTATAAYQIEGSAYGQCGPSHWDTFAATPGNVANGESGSIACDHFHRFEQDLDLVQACGFDSYRFSTSWARIMPDGRNINEEGLDFYDRLADAICARNLKPNLTLYHWDLPSALSDIGGWANRDTPERFVDHTNAVIQRIGDRMEAVSTINEPWCVAWLSYFLGHHAPGLQDIRAAARAMHHVLLAHGLSAQSIRSVGNSKLGIVLNLTEAQSVSTDPADLVAKERLDGIHNRWFLDAIIKGVYPEDILKELGKYMPTDFEEDMKLISAPIDWLGINYYTRGIVASDPSTPWPSIKNVDGPLEKTQMGWEIYPDGLKNLLVRLSRDYTGKLPLMITENGMASADQVKNGSVCDGARSDYISAHLGAAKAAIDAGVNLQGFFYWSLLDNFEWAFGYGKRFGLVHVDYETQRRTPKASYHDWAASLKS